MTFASSETLAPWNAVSIGTLYCLGHKTTDYRAAERVNSAESDVMAEFCKTINSLVGKRRIIKL
jgi:hypothetical protein